MKSLDQLSKSGYNYRIKALYKQYIKAQSFHEKELDNVSYEAMLGKWDDYKQAKEYKSYYNKLRNLRNKKG